MSKILFSIVLFLMIPLTDLVGQEAVPVVKLGDRVRVLRNKPFDYWTVGTLSALDADTLFVKEETYRVTVAIPLVSVTKSEVEAKTSDRREEVPVPGLLPILPTNVAEQEKPALKPHRVQHSSRRRMILGAFAGAAIGFATSEGARRLFDPMGWCDFHDVDVVLCSAGSIQ